MGNGAHGADGRFCGAHRVTVESVPRLPTFPAAWTLDDPQTMRVSRVLGRPRWLDLLQPSNGIDRWRQCRPGLDAERRHIPHQDSAPAIAFERRRHDPVSVPVVPATSALSLPSDSDRPQTRPLSRTALPGMRRSALGIPGDVPKRCRARLLSRLAPAWGDQKPDDSRAMGSPCRVPSPVACERVPAARAQGGQRPAKDVTRGL